MMYFVTITQTDEQYKIAHPLTEIINGQEYAVSSPENDKLVSPTFMLASQLEHWVVLIVLHGPMHERIVQIM